MAIHTLSSTKHNEKTTSCHISWLNSHACMLWEKFHLWCLACKLHRKSLVQAKCYAREDFINNTLYAIMHCGSLNTTATLKYAQARVKVIMAVSVDQKRSDIKQKTCIYWLFGYSQVFQSFVHQTYVEHKELLFSKNSPSL